MELASHLETKAGKLHWEGLGRIKMALVGNDTSSLLEILEGSFGHIDLVVSILSGSIEVPIKKSTAAEKSPEKTPEKTSEKPSVLLSEGPEPLSHYRCQYPSCNQEFSQKAAACNLVHHDHLNIALACLYYSFDDNPKMWWYSASAWEHHTCKHALNNLPIYPDNPVFFQQFVEIEAIPSTSKVTPELPHVDIIHKWAIVAKKFLEEESDESTFPLTKEHEPRLPEAPKQHIKQGPVKSSKKWKENVESKIKDYDK